MEIKLNAKLSAYSKVDAVNGMCEHEYVTTDDIDSLFTEEHNSSILDTTDPNAVTFADIDSLFN